MNDSPIFIHSLFRSGSTYLFNVFRRSETNGYWCYQEPLHEMTYFSKDRPSDLLDGFRKKESKINRHPLMTLPYFQELYDIWPAWKETISEASIYEAYFSPSDADIGISFWQTLIHASKARPVIQECRTSSRIEDIKEKIGGYHIYLWRNPWDQWWSYKVTDYFDIVNQIIINSDFIPEVVKELRNNIAFEIAATNDIKELFNYFSLRAITSEESYLIFYTLWCLGLHEGLKNADLILNIDRLSESHEYRTKIENMFLEADIQGIDFSDCYIPQGVYQESECKFFEELELKVHNWLMQTGWTQFDIEQIVLTKMKFEPSIRQKEIETINPEDLVEQIVRARKLAIHSKNKEAIVSKRLLANISEVNAENFQLANKLKQLEAKVYQMENSLSWRITSPLRELNSKFKTIKLGSLFKTIEPKPQMNNKIENFNEKLNKSFKHPLINLRAYLLNSPELRRKFKKILNFTHTQTIGRKAYSFFISSIGEQDLYTKVYKLNTPSDLNPKARAIYFQLKAAIEYKQQKEKK